MSWPRPLDSRDRDRGRTMLSMKCAEVNCHEQATTVSQVALGDARFAVPACEWHDVGDVDVAPCAPEPSLEPAPVAATG